MSAPTKASAWRAWLPALVWLGLIAVESTGTFSAQNTGRILYPLLHALFGLELAHFHTWHFFLRKSGHVIGYGILSLLLFRAWRATVRVKGDLRWAWVWCLDAILMTSLVASLDEWHQSFLPSRTGSVQDVLLDTTAALLAQGLLFAWLRGWRSGVPNPREHRSAAPIS